MELTEEQLKRYAHLDQDPLANFREKRALDFDRAIDLKVLRMLDAKLYVCNLRESVNSARRCRKINALYFSYYQSYRKKWGYMD